MNHSSGGSSVIIPPQATHLVAVVTPYRGGYECRPVGEYNECWSGEIKMRRGTTNDLKMVLTTSNHSPSPS